MSHLPTLHPLPEYAQGFLDALADPAFDDNAVESVLEDLPGPMEERAILIAKGILSGRSLAAQIKAEEERLTERRQCLERRLERSRQYLLFLLKTSGVEKIDHALLRLRVKKCPPAVERIDPDLLPDAYWREWVEREPDKKTIIDAWKAGIPVKGATVVQRQKVEIK